LRPLCVDVGGQRATERDGDTAQCADAWIQLDAQRVFIVDGGDEDMLDDLVRGTLFN
jgi:hypothetical protein